LLWGLVAAGGAISPGAGQETADSTLAKPLPPVTALAVAPDGKRVVVGSQAGVEIRSWPGLKEEGKVATKLRHVYDLAFAPGGKKLAVAGGAPADFGDVEIHDWPPAIDSVAVRLAAKPTDCVMKVFWSDNETLWLAGADKIARQVD
jgi:WD40 repeat protein